MLLFVVDEPELLATENSAENPGVNIGKKMAPQAKFSRKYGPLLGNLPPPQFKIELI